MIDSHFTKYRSSLVLTVIIVCLFEIAVYQITSPVVRKHEQGKKAALSRSSAETSYLKRVFPSLKSFSKLGEWTVNGQKASYYKTTAGDNSSGYVIESYGEGFGGLIKTLISLDSQFKIVNIDILSQSETPGLGDAVMQDDFKKQFSGKHLHELKITTSGESSMIQAVTGATISSKAVAEDAVRRAVEYLKNLHASGTGLEAKSITSVNLSSGK